jgi:hypothetical protein
MLYVVRQAWWLDAPSERDAVAMAGTILPTFTRVNESTNLENWPKAPLPWMLSPLPMLNRAWDAFHEREIQDALDDGMPDPLPTFVELSLAGFEPLRISALFDVAIHANLEHFPRQAIP